MCFGIQQGGVHINEVDFTDHIYPEDYIDWEASIENYFEWKSLMEPRKALFVKIKFKGRVLAWWKRAEDRVGKERRSLHGST